jgi:amidase
MSLSNELKYLDATALAGLVRKKEVQPFELVDDAIGRMEKLNPELNAVITPMYELAREAAKARLSEGPFTGVPFLLKDGLALDKGVPTSMGSKLLKQHAPDHDSELVSRYKKAGLIVLGKTNAPEFGILPTTEPEAFGATKNPWNVKHTPGGSSGGSAAAVAARMVPMAHGNDGGGSIRIPASCCGLFGLKPTRARISLAPDFGDVMGGAVNEHALTLSVRDSAALLDATAGCLPGDPYWAPPLPGRLLRRSAQTPEGCALRFCPRRSMSPCTRIA